MQILIILISIQVPPKIDQQGPVMMKATLGSTAELPCRVSGVPKPRIMWQKGTKMVADLPGRIWSSVLLPSESVNIQEIMFLFSIRLVE